MERKMNDEKFQKLLEGERKDGLLVDKVAKAVAPFLMAGAAMFIPEGMNFPYCTYPEFNNLMKIGAGIITAGTIPLYASTVYFTARTIYRDDFCNFQDEKEDRRNLR